jgi:ferredoxin
VAWTIEANRERCIGSGSCAFMAPDVFDVDDEGRVLVLRPQVEPDDRVREAVTHCPMEALRILDPLER